LQNGTNVTAGATGVTLTVPKATALIYGSVKDNLGNPLVGLDVYANDNNNLYQTDGYTDASGNYVLGVLGLGSSDSWYVQANGNNQLTNYIFTQENINGNINAGQAVLQNFTAILATNNPGILLTAPTWLGNAQFGFTLNGSPGTSYTVLATTNVTLPLSNWFTVLVTNLPGNSAFIQDNQATNKQRFYRVVAPISGLSMLTPYVNESDMASINEAFSTSTNAPWGFAHNGIDFMPNGDGKAFQAVASGVVQSVDLWQNGQNWQVNVWIQHDSTSAFDYTFEPMSSLQQDGQIQRSNILVAVGQPLSPGDLIGNLHTVYDYSHVHFGLLTNYQAVCPEPYFIDQARQSILRVLYVAWPGASMCY
jgi:hypothetical protein